MKNSLLSGPIRHLVLCLAGNAIAFTAVGLAMAQQVTQPADLTTDVNSEENAPRRYAVEMIVFAYRDSNSADTEVFLPESPAADDMLPNDSNVSAGGGDFGAGSTDLPDAASNQPDDRSSIPEYSDNTAMSNAASRVTPAPVALAPEELVLNEVGSAQQMGLQVLSPSEYSLDEVYERLQQLDAYQPLLRTAWSQLTVPEEQSRAFNLRRLGNPPLHLEGTVTLYLGRYLHLVLDLALEDRSSLRQIGSDYSNGKPADQYVPPGSRQSAQGQFEAENELTPVMPQGPVYFRIQEDRIVRNGELRYFDHPKFGVVAKITRVEEGGALPSNRR